jgi:hypothetical protein
MAARPEDLTIVVILADIRVPSGKVLIACFVLLAKSSRRHLQLGSPGRPPAHHRGPSRAGMAGGDPSVYAEWIDFACASMLACAW